MSGVSKEMECIVATLKEKTTPHLKMLDYYKYQVISYPNSTSVSEYASTSGLKLESSCVH